jgi:hypothetical protein
MNADKNNLTFRLSIADFVNADNRPDFVGFCTTATL